MSDRPMLAMMPRSEPNRRLAGARTMADDRAGGEVYNVGTRTKPKKRTIGFVTMWPEGERWRCRFLDPKSGADVRRLIPEGPPDKDPAEWAEAWAWDMQASILNGRGLLPSMRQKIVDPLEGTPSVREALLGVIALSRGAKKHTTRLRAEVNHFLAWAKRAHPSLTLWGEITKHIWRSYDRALDGEELSRDGRKHRWEPLRRASRYWADESPDLFRDTLKAAGIAMQKRIIKDPPAMTGAQLAAFMEWAKANAPDIYGVAALQAWAGLRMYEAAFIRECDVDLGAGSVTVTTTPMHKVKNDYSERTVPVAGVVVEALRWMMERRKVLAVDGKQPLFSSTRGVPYTEQAIEKRWRRVIGFAKVAGLSIPAKFSGHHCRATFSTLCEFDAGANRAALNRYCGRAPADVMGQHYSAIPWPRLKGLVVDPFARYWAEGEAAGWQETGNDQMAAGGEG